MTTVEKAIILARKHVGNGAAMDSSARLCLADAIELYDAEDFQNARKHACKALAYSVGIGHRDYIRAAGKDEPAWQVTDWEDEPDHDDDDYERDPLPRQEWVMERQEEVARDPRPRTA